ncbi:MAG: NosD domain-containing protein [Promethearchaeota archaeon]
MPLSLEQVGSTSKIPSQVRSSTSAMVMTTSLSYTPHDPIEVSNDEELAAEAVSGNGTEADPYVLEGWNITTEGVHGIHIRNTTAHFIVRNCWVETGNTEFVYGIFIRDIAAETAKISTNSFFNNWFGLYLRNTSTVIVANNNCQNNFMGICMSLTPSTIVANNICQNNTYGFYLSESTNSTIANNSFIGDGLVLNDYSSLDTYLSYSIVNNSVNRLPLGYFTNLSDLTLLSTYGQLLLINCTRLIIQNQVCSNTSRGMALYYSTACYIHNNTFSHNSLQGIYLKHSGSSIIENNSCTRNNGVGITLEYLSKATVTNNLCYDNIKDGIYSYFAHSLNITNNLCQKNADGIYVYQSEASMVINNSCSYNRKAGIRYAGQSIKSSMIAGNLCYQNYGTGISLAWFSHSMVINNVCTQNNAGISFERSDQNSVRGNFLLDNQGYGIHLNSESDNNSLHHNSFLHNNNGSIQAADDGVNNQWYNNSTAEGNYWFDYTGTGVYQLAGDAGATDTYPILIDSDEDGMADGWEYLMGLNLTDPSDAALDFDHDGLTNLFEFLNHLNATNADTDGDLMPDGWEFTNVLDPLTPDATSDPDNDTLSNFDEYLFGTNPHQADTDTDGLPDAAEIHVYSTNPTVADSDADGLSDYAEVIDHNTNPNIVDSDTDGLSDYAEVITHKTDPNNPDSDDDGLSDGEEVLTHKTDPLNSDSDDDGLSDGEEVYKYKTNPMDSDSDNDLFPDNWDYGWWGNPRINWDNPLTRGVSLILLVTLLGLAAWSSFVAYQLPRLHQGLKRQFQPYKQLTNQFLETVKALQTSENLNEVEAAADDLHHTFQACEESLLFAHRFVTRKWLPPFLRLDLTLWNAIFTTVKDTYEEFQETRMKRLDAKY